eukprot:CAMPEP_0174264476 /NCGR_PEP_ID=MMETSP0439-20130205/22603_1 /TAXON_ID=0 /ORGANISM="Stereomyxa ramosa, Strain Chinc5" /LENGTH=32 /DNA_ID= /DNA_START= /DNA_END= /DNA_ORIENTATION=
MKRKSLWGTWGGSGGNGKSKPNGSLTPLWKSW